MTIKKRKLNARQEKFCKLYSSDEEFFCNGVQAYIEAYNPKKKGNWYNSAKASAFNLLTKTDILNRIDELMELRGLNDVYVDKQLEKLITQDADFKVKLGGIKEYNSLKQRITQKLDHTSGGEKIGIIIMPQKNVENISKEQK